MYLTNWRQVKVPCSNVKGLNTNRFDELGQKKGDHYQSFSEQNASICCTMNVQTKKKKK